MRSNALEPTLYTGRRHRVVAQRLHVHEYITTANFHEVSMPIIGANQRGKHLVPFVGNLAIENNETLYAYAHFIGKAPEFVLNRLISTVLAMDPDYCEWRNQHRESFTPQRLERRISSRRPNAGRGRERPPATGDINGDV